MPLPPALLILGTTQYDDDDDDLCGKCLNVKGKFKSPTSDTVSIINSHISDTTSNSYESLITGTELKTIINPIIGPVTNKPKTLPLAHNSNKSLKIDTDSTKNTPSKALIFYSLLRSYLNGTFDGLYFGFGPTNSVRFFKLHSIQHIFLILRVKFYSIWFVTNETVK